MPPDLVSDGNVRLILGALMIFFLRVTDMSLDSIRVLSMVKGHRVRAMFLGIFESGIFIFAISQVLSPPLHWLQMAGYAGGFGVGTFVGSYIANRFMSGFVLMRVITRTHGRQMAEALREKGCRVTVVDGRGKDGMVPVLFTVIERRLSADALDIVMKIDEKCFVTQEPIERAVGGFVPNLSSWQPSVRR